MAANDINASKFKSEVLDSNIPVLVDFWAPWCGPCRMMAPILDELSIHESMVGKLKIVKINTEEHENQAIAMQFNIRSIPNMKLFKNGEVVHDIVGMRPLQQMISEISPHLDDLAGNLDEELISDEAKKWMDIEIKRFYDENLSHASYAIYSSGKVALVDPERDPKKYYDFAKDRKARIVAVFETHPHADFVSSHYQINAELGATILVSRLVGADYPHRSFDDGDTFEMGNAIFESINTPGHSPDSISILLRNIHGIQLGIFTGDTLFVGDAGRPDLRESAGNIHQQREELAALLYESLYRKIASLDQDISIYPAHGAGSLCGKNLSDSTDSTLGKELETNIALNFLDENEFKQYILADQPYVPKYFPHSVELNRRGAMTMDFVRRNLPDIVDINYETMLIDIRSKRDFQLGHYKGSVNIQFDGKFETWLGSIISPDEKFIIITNEDKNFQPKDVLERVAKIGYEKNIAGFNLNPGNHQDYEEISYDELKKSISSYNIIDVRSEIEFNDSKLLKESINIPLNNLRERISEVKTDKPIVIHCAGGYRSATAASIVSPLVNQKVYDLGEDISKFIIF